MTQKHDDVIVWTHAHAQLWHMWLYAASYEQITVKHVAQDLIFQSFECLCITHCRNESSQTFVL